MTITVRAISANAFEENMAVGFFGNKRRYRGEVFEIEDHSQLGRWMEEVDPKTGKAISTKKKPKKKRRPTFDKSETRKVGE